MHPPQSPKGLGVTDRQRGGAFVFCPTFVISYCRLLQVIKHYYRYYSSKVTADTIVTSITTAINVIIGTRIALYYCGILPKDSAGEKKVTKYFSSSFLLKP